MATPTIAVIGGLDVDLVMISSRFPTPGESVEASDCRQLFGGKGANTAVAACRTSRPGPTSLPSAAADIVDSEITAATQKDSVEVKLLGAVGDDEHGCKFIQKLRLEGIDVTSIRLIPNTRTSTCFVTIVEQPRENTCVFCPSATSVWQPSDVLTVEDLGGGVKPDLVIAQMEIATGVVERMIAIAGAAGVGFCLNAPTAKPIAKDLYRHLTHFIVDESEAAILLGCRREEGCTQTWPLIVQHFLDLWVKNVVITLGARGAYYASASARQTGHCHTYDVVVVDTTGAGHVWG